MKIVTSQQRKLRYYVHDINGLCVGRYFLVWEISFSQFLKNQFSLKVSEKPKAIVFTKNYFGSVLHITLTIKVL